MLVMRAYFGVLISLSLMVAAMSLWEFRGQSSTFLFAHLSGHINEGSVYSQPTTETNDQIPSEERILTGIKAVGTCLTLPLPHHHFASLFLGASDPKEYIRRCCAPVSPNLLIRSYTAWHSTTCLYPAGDPSGWCVGGLVGGYTCCPASCGACGGVDCANRPVKLFLQQRCFIERRTILLPIRCPSDVD